MGKGSEAGRQYEFCHKALAKNSLHLLQSIAIHYDFEKG